MPLVSSRRIEQSKLVTAKKAAKKKSKYTPPSIRALRIGYDLEDPITRDRAVAEVATALDAAEGNAIQAAIALEVSHRALLRWLEKTPELAARLARLRVQYGQIDRRVKS